MRKRDKKVIDLKKLMKKMNVFKGVGKLPICDTWRSIAQILHLKGKNEKEGQEKYADVGCGQPLLCFVCGKVYTMQKSRKYISLVEALYIRFPALQVVHQVFTLPRSHKWHMDETKATFKAFFQAVRRVILTLYPDCGLIMILHNWSSKNPEEKNIHIHTIILPIDKSGNIYSGYTDLEYLKDIYRAEIGLGKDEPVNIYSKYFKREEIGKIKHLLAYDLRSPIEDFVKVYPDNTLTKAFLDRVEHLKCGMQRIRFAGWFSNRTKRKQLLKWGIVQDGKDELWELIERTQLAYVRDDQAYLKNGQIIPFEMIESMEDIDLQGTWKAGKENKESI